MATLGTLVVVAIAILFLVKAGLIPALANVAVAVLGTLTKTAAGGAGKASSLRDLLRRISKKQAESVSKKIRVAAAVDPEATSCTLLKSDETLSLTLPMVEERHRPQPISILDPPTGGASSSSFTLRKFFDLRSLLGLDSAEETDSEESEDAEEGAVVGHAKDSLRSWIQENVSALPGALLGEAVGQCVEQLSAVLEQVNVGRDVLGRAWVGADELVEYRKVTTQNPESHFVVVLIDHQISLDQCASLELKLGEKTLATVDFPINFTVRLSAARLEIQAGRIRRLHAESSVASGSIWIGERVLAQTPEKPLDLGTIDLGEGIPLGA
jgi:hypothetical protein